MSKEMFKGSKKRAESVLITKYQRRLNEGLSGVSQIPGFKELIGTPRETERGRWVGWPLSLLIPLFSRRTALIVRLGLSKCLYFQFGLDEMGLIKGSHRNHIQMQHSSEGFLIWYLAHLKITQPQKEVSKIWSNLNVNYHSS